MPYLNPYIEKVESHPRIFEKTEDITAHKGGWSDFFGNDKPISVEIGTGLGNFFAREASEHPDKNFVGLEIKYKRLWRTMEKCEKAGRGDVVLIKEYAQKIGEIFEEGEIDSVYILYPDPWPKKRHWKNRLIQTEFLEDLARVMKVGGRGIFKTDDQPYFEWALEHFEKCQQFRILSHDSGLPSQQAAQVTETEFELIWRAQGRSAHYIEFEKLD